MAINATTNYLLAKKSESLLAFARQLTNVTVMLYGPGQLDVSGMPVACAGRLKRLVVFDGTTVGSVDSDVDIDTGDQIAVQAQFNNTAFTITVLKNSIATSLSLPEIGGYRPIWATVLIELTDPVLI